MLEPAAEALHAMCLDLVAEVCRSEALMERRLAEIPSEEWGDLKMDLSPR